MCAPKISITIPTYNRKNDVLECLKSLQELDYPNYEIIVIDNGSTDGTSQAIKQVFPNVRLIRNVRNMGVTGGRNLGVKYSTGEYIFFLDHDTTVASDVLSKLLIIMKKNSKIGVAGPIVCYYDDPERIWAAGTSVDLFTGKVTFNTKVPIKKRNSSFSVQVLPTAFLVRRVVLDKIGLFDDLFFATYEDADFCLRVREIGYNIICTPDVKVLHKAFLNHRNQFTDSHLKTYYTTRNRIIFMKKHAKLSNLIIFLIAFLPLYAMYYSLIFIFLGKNDFLKSYWLGLISGLKAINKPSIIYQSKIIGVF